MIEPLPAVTTTTTHTATADGTNNTNDQKKRKKKSNAQIQRMILRAKARGEVYDDDMVVGATENNQEPVQTLHSGCGQEQKSHNSKKQQQQEQQGQKQESIDKEQQQQQQHDHWCMAAETLQQAWHTLDRNVTLKAKERRSAKRKAAALAMEATSGVESAQALLDWYHKQQPKQQQQQQDPNHQDDDISGKLSKKKKHRTDAYDVNPLTAMAQHEPEASANINNNNNKNNNKRSSNPYIFFVGQLAYETTAQDLLQHIQATLLSSTTVDCPPFSPHNFCIRLLTDAKTGRSRGMAFVQIVMPSSVSTQSTFHGTEEDDDDDDDDNHSKPQALSKNASESAHGTKQQQPDEERDINKKEVGAMTTTTWSEHAPALLYSCLKWLHHTVLHGRRINVEKTAGGNGSSSHRREKLDQYRHAVSEQSQADVSQLLQEYIQRGDIAAQGELDPSVQSYCEKHARTTVEAAIQKYVETRGRRRHVDNPSAYLTFLITKFANEGIRTKSHPKKS